MSHSFQDHGFKKFLVSYQFEGAEWNIEIPARSFEDAERRVTALAKAKCDGQAVASLPIPRAIPSPWQAIKTLFVDSRG